MFIIDGRNNKYLSLYLIFEYN